MQLVLTFETVFGLTFDTVYGLTIEIVYALIFETVYGLTFETFRSDLCNGGIRYINIVVLLVVFVYL